MSFQLAVKLMLDVTGWDVIECSAASFVPHFMEHAQVRQFGGLGLHQQILAVTTLFIMGKMMGIFRFLLFLPAYFVPFTVFAELDAPGA